MFLIDIVLENPVEVTIFVQFLLLLDFLYVHDKLDQVRKEHFDLGHDSDAHIGIFPKFIRLEVQNQECDDQGDKGNDLRC